MSDTIEPKQARSRKTVARLLAATVDTLDAHGLAGTTIPRIAEAAGVAPASIYRRFRDKEALIRATLLDVLERSNAVNAAAVAPMLEGRSLAWVAGALARSLVLQYRVRPGLMRALIRFAESDTDAAFKERAMTLMTENLRMIVEEIVARFADEIEHPDPRHAVTFAALAVANIAETHALEEFSLWHAALPLTDDELQRDLKRLFLGYLRVAP